MAEDISLGFNEGISFKDIALNHFKRIGKLASVEFRGGYWEDKILIVNGGSARQRVYVPDTSEIYSNSVEYLHDLLLPHFDDRMKRASEKYEADSDQAFNEHTKVEGTSKEFANETEKKRFRIKRVRIVRKLFQELSKFLCRENYFDLEDYKEDLEEEIKDTQ